MTRRYLAVRRVRAHPRYGQERVTTAQDDLSPEQRRQLWWRARRLFEAWPPGSVLVLAPAAVQADQVNATVTVDWRFQKPGQVLEQPEVVASGQAQLKLVRHAQGWRLRQVERLVDGLKAGLGG